MDAIAGTSVKTSSSSSSSTTKSYDDLIEYLCHLGKPLVDKLYTNSATSLAVFRELPEMAKHCVMRLLFVEQPIPQTVITSWVKNTRHVLRHISVFVMFDSILDFSEHLEASEVLTKLNVWKSQTLQTGLPGWLLNQSFRDSLKTALLGGGEQWSVYKELPKDKHSPDIESLDSYANKRW
ncbi:unnamed protein product, partial [Medioppia subpectinata]